MNGISHSYQLGQSISDLGLLGCIFFIQILIRASKHAYTLSLGSKNLLTAFILLSRRCP